MLIVTNGPVFLIMLMEIYVSRHRASVEADIFHNWATPVRIIEGMVNSLKEALK
jgi:hypothetical protein